MATEFVPAGNVPFFVPFLVTKEVATLSGQSQSKVNLNHLNYRIR
jgi:hypothetical protein